MTEEEFMQKSADALKRLNEMNAKREWIDLTATEIKILRRAANNDREFAALLIARFKEKNGG
jgi:hypothetical protein